MSTLDPRAYRPFSSVEDYILGCTDEIWVDRGVGLIESLYYAPDVVVHGAYGTSAGVAPVVQGTLQSISSFPDEVGYGEDVVWEPRGSDGFVSAHRVYSTGTNTGWTDYGPPRGRPFEKRAIAHCLVRGGRIVEEWVVRDEARLVTDLGHDVAELAERLALASPWRPLDLEVPDDVLHRGVSGERRASADDDAERVLEALDVLWNQHRLDRAPHYLARDVVLRTTRGRTRQGVRQFATETLDLHAAFPDAVLRPLDVCAHQDARRGRRVTVVWLLEGTYSGYAVYGPATRAPIQLLGASEFSLAEGRIEAEYRVYDELALAVQIAQGRRQVTE